MSDFCDRGTNESKSTSSPSTSCDNSLELHVSGTDTERLYPQDLRLWKRLHLLRLKIEPRLQHVEPVDFIKRYCRGKRKDDEPLLYRTVDVLEKRRDTLVNGCLEALRWISFFTSGYEELSASDVRYVLERFERTEDLWEGNDTLRLVKVRESKWCSRFEVLAERLCTYLYDAKKMEERGEPVIKCMYQMMFDTFAYMFGLNGRFVTPNGIPKKSMTVMEREVYGDSDILFKTREGNYSGGGTVLVTKMKPIAVEESDLLCPALQKRRRLAHSESSNADCAEQEGGVYFNLEDGIMGEHCGELLMHYQESLMENAVLGAIVEKTKVILSVFTATPDQVKRMLSGELNLNEEQRPLFMYTKAYDYLKQEDRNDLIGVFVRLGLIQATGRPF